MNTDLTGWFKLGDHSVRSDTGLVYVSNEATIRRFNDVYGLNWGLYYDSNEFEVHPDTTSKGKVQFLSTYTVTLEIIVTDNKRFQRIGTGAGVNYDPDTAVKTALAEAMKKAANQYGVAGYLWDKSNCDMIITTLKDPSPENLQGFLVQYAISHGATPSKEGVADFFGVMPEAMTDEATLERLAWG